MVNGNDARLGSSSLRIGHGRLVGEQIHARLHPKARTNSSLVPTSSRQRFNKMKGLRRDAPVHAMEG